VTVRTPGGLVVERRRATNIVLRGGAELIAQRFAGVAAAGPIDRVKIGFGTDVATSDVTKLTPPAAVGIPASALETALDPSAFTISNEQLGMVSVAVSALFTPALDGPNPARSGNRDNVGDVWVVATHTPGADAAPMRARAHLVVTVPLYMRWDNFTMRGGGL